MLLTRLPGQVNAAIQTPVEPIPDSSFLNSPARLGEPSRKSTAQ
jgi:hypothetical protein